MTKSIFSLVATAMVASIVFVSCEKDDGLIVDEPVSVNKAFVDEDFPNGFLHPSALKAVGELSEEVIDFVDGAVPVFFECPKLRYCKL